ncbi:MAG: hypothetical protein AAFY25_09440 [Pseudomonadota bacterium]
MNVFLHIGDARTGSSTLQALLFHNRARLAAEGVDYPVLGTREGKGVAHHKLPFSLLPQWPVHSPIAPVAADDIWGAMRDHLDRSEARVTVLSSEAFLNLSEASVAYVKEALRGHEVTPICVRRDPEDWRRSWRAHRIRQGEVVSPPKQPARDLAGPKMARWGAAFDLVTLPYSKTVLGDVVAAMGLDLAKLETAHARNQSCSDAVLERLNVLNAMALSEANRAALCVVLGDASGVLKGVNLDDLDRAAFNQRVIDFLAR